MKLKNATEEYSKDEENLGMIKGSIHLGDIIILNVDAPSNINT